MALIAHYPLNGDTKDYSGYGRHGTATSVEWIDGKTGLSAKLDGASNRISIPTPPIGVYFTVALWHYSDPEVGSSSWRTLIGATGNTHPLIFSGRVSLGVFDGGFKSFNYTIPINVWIHISVVYDILGKSASLYINGVFESSISINYNSTSNPINAIGGAVGFNYSSGYTDDVRIYDHALSDKEIKELAKAKVLHYKFDEQDLTTKIVKDCSGFGNDGTVAVATAPSWSEDSPVGRGSMEFSGGKFITLPNRLGSDEQITVCAWFKTNGLGGSGYHIIMGGTEVELDVTSSGQARFGLIVNNVRQVHNYSSGLADGKYHHICGVYDGSIKSIYVDGVLVGSDPAVGKIKNNIIRRVGVFGTSTNYHANGNIADVRIYATALTPEDILELYQTRASVDNEGNLFVHEINEMSPTLKSIDSRGIASYIEFNEMGEDNKMSIGADGVVYVNEIMET